jgi:hypothetical protein
MLSEAREALGVNLETEDKDDLVAGRLWCEMMANA